MAIKLSGPCKRVELLKMVLMNFKGFEGKVEILFNEKENEIIGDNGAGKSSVQDALIWVFTGRTKEGDSKSVEVINDDSNDCRVEVHFVDEDGDLHSIIRRQKKTKNGLLSTINLDFENILQKDLSVIIDDEKLLSIVNPMYFQSLDKDKAREVILSIMPEIKKEDVLNKIPGDKKDLIKDDSFELNDTNLYLTEQRRKIRELEKNQEFKKGYLGKLEEKIELPKEMKYDEEKIKELEEKLNKMSGENPKVKDIKELLLERNKLEEKIRVLKSKDDKKEVTQDISNKILLLKKDLEVLKTSKQEELDIKESEKTLISLRGEYLQKQKDVERIQKEIKALEEKKRKHRVGDVCFTCKQALTEEAVKKLQEEVQNDINKKLKELQDAEKEFKEVSSKGVELAKEVEKIKTKYKMELEKFEIEKEKKSSKINKDIMDLQKQLEEINKAQNASEVKKEISAIENKIKELNIEKIEEENKKTIKEFEDKIASEREAIMKELNVTRKLKEEVVKNNAKKEELTKLKKENAEKAVKEKQDIKEIDEEVKVLNKKIDQMRNFNSEMMKITNEILSRHLDKVEISLQKVLKTSGEIRDDFEVFYDGRALRKCSLSEAIKAGIELSYMISQLTGLEFPVIVDNSESITDIDSSKAFQIIKLRVEKDEPLSYKKDDGRFEAIYVKKEREKEIKPNIIEIVGA